MGATLKQIFDNSRQELLDMGLRGNTLLSIGKGAKVLEIVDEKSTQVFDLLVEQGKSMKFLPAPGELEDDENQTVSLEDLTEHLEANKGGGRHSDNALQTQLFKKSLNTRLLKLNSEALTFVQEQGVDLLYLATGFLKWYEDDNSDKARFAPLVLIPVELVRADAGESYKLRYTDADLGTNLTLAAKLKMEFGIELPDFAESDNGYDLDSYFADVERAISQEKRWQVDHNKIVLSFFSFGKFQMYQDLSDDVWPEGKKPSQHSLIQKLFADGFESDANTIDSTPMDVNRVEDVQLVLDSDSSQTEAVLAAKSGANLVIQGPPGTGKSQTITNIISQALADNKKVLFVAEKMAALDVVKRRLDNCHLGDAVLELHSHKAKKQTVLESLEKALMQFAPVTPERSDDIEQLVALRGKLDGYCKAVNHPIADTGYSYNQALGFAMQYQQECENAELSTDTLPDTHFEPDTWSRQQFNLVLGKLTELVDHLSEHGAPADNIFSSTALDDFSPASHKEAEQVVARVQSLSTSLYDALASEYQVLGATLPGSDNHACQRAFSTLTFLSQRPALTGVNTDAQFWQEKGSRLKELASQGMALHSTRQTLAAEFTDEAFDFHWANTRGTLVNLGSKWWRFLSGDYRKAKNTVAGMRRNGLTGSAQDWVKEIDALVSFNSEQKQFAETARELFSAIGDHYRGTQTDWTNVHATVSWLHQYHSGLADGTVDRAFEVFGDGEKPLTLSQASLDKMSSLINELQEKVAHLTQTLQLDASEWGERLDNLTQVSLEQLSADLDGFYSLTRFNRLAQQLGEFGLAAWSSAAFGWSADARLLAVGFKARFFNFLVNHQYEQSAAIRYFDRVEHEKVIEQFSAIDGQLFNFAQETLVKQLYDNLPNPAARGEVETLRREFNKKRRQMPIRRLLNKAGRAVQQIKPVFMMSPMSIATYLEPGAAEFDLVIFDEASQVKVADALGAILRGRQVIVVGDTKQMPPTNFFGKQLVLDDEEAEQSLTADMESILGMFLASGTPERMLKWHYRSRHESLIAVSNQEFYDNKLMIFPSPGINPNADGLSFHYLPDTTYDRGGARNNIGEAQAVARAVMAHAQQKPNLTLGVVAFSTAQRDAILLEVERLRKENPAFEHFFAERDDAEDFFVKNLENVQGDERDTILISIGYGKTQEGRLPMSFGPLNSDGGERRLNVLISRARMSMKVFCNFKAEEMPTTESSPFGVRALKNYLHYAESGELVTREETGKGPDSPFEEEVISAIRSLGYQVQPQVGCAGFYIDIAVRDPKKPGRYMLAVECDGATYHSSKSARDRDRIRQSVLEGLGWRFHRIWSTDWFRNSYKETQRLGDAIKAAAAYYQALDEVSDNHQSTVQATEKKTKPVASIERVAIEHEVSVAEYQSCQLDKLSLRVGLQIPEVPLHILAKDIRTIVDIESPVHSKQLAIRLLGAVGAARSGARINKAILMAVEELRSQGEIQLDGDHLISAQQAGFIVRSRHNLADNERKFDYIYDGEIKKAAVDTVSETYSISNDDLVKTVTEVLGFMTTSKAMRLRVEGALSELEAAGTLERKGDIYQSIS